MVEQRKLTREPYYLPRPTRAEIVAEALAELACKLAAFRLPADRAALNQENSNAGR